MADSESPWELLDLLEGRCEVPDEVQRLRIFQENCCEALAGFLPTEAEGWLKVARAYRFGEATSADLEAVRITAWEHLGSASCEVSNPRVAAVRAVIGLLYPDDYSAREGDSPRVTRFEWLDYFLDYCNRVVDRREDQARLLRQLFPELSGTG